VPPRPLPPRPLPRATGAQLTRAGEIEVLSWPWLDALGVDAVVTTRECGVSVGPYRALNLGLHVGDDPDLVAENRRRAAGALGARVDDLVFANQVHGTRAALVGAGDAGRGARDAADAIEEADALVTTEPGIVLVTLVADCSPVLVVDPEARVLATVHAGWRGAVAGTLREAIALMTTLGARPDRIVAAIGPTVSPKAYAVGTDVEAAARDAFGDRADEVLRPHGDRFRFDVAGANRLQLGAAGVLENQIAVSPFASDDGPFFSDRKARPCGRFGLLARLR
jgi:YfiH family protein